ncbi:MAG: DUF883 family protein [Alphaproteobacteria bacterium]|nr:MAG: DUF883 family protein [Alphaproteobacteria bacterium]
MQASGRHSTFLSGSARRRSGPDAGRAATSAFAMSSPGNGNFTPPTGYAAIFQIDGNPWNGPGVFLNWNGPKKCLPSLLRILDEDDANGACEGRWRVGNSRARPNRGDTKMAERDYAKEITAIKGDVEKLRADLARLLAALGDDLEAKGGELKNRAAERLALARAQASGSLERVEDAIEEKPLTALGVAVGVGFLIGALIGRR